MGIRTQTERTLEKAFDSGLKNVQGTLQTLKDCRNPSPPPFFLVSILSAPKQATVAELGAHRSQNPEGGILPIQSVELWYQECGVNPCCFLFSLSSHHLDPGQAQLQKHMAEQDN